MSPEPVDPNVTSLPPQITRQPDPASPPTVYSPSPVPGQPDPQRRSEDTKSYAVEWGIVIGGVALWGSTFLVDMAAYETWSEIMTPKFMGLHLGQLLGVIAATLGAKRIK